jgi:uncharacterized GH25 family protein
MTPLRSPLSRFTRIVLLILLAVPALAHDTWVVPSTFRPAAGETVRLRLVTSEEFPHGESAVRPHRIARFTLRTPDGTSQVEGYRVEGPDLVAEVRVPSRAAGVRAMIVAETHPFAFVLEPEIFNRYLTEEALTAVIEARAARGESNAAGRERYAKIAKAVLCDDDPAEDAAEFYARPEDLWLEIIPLANPCALRVGDRFPVEVRFLGRPLPGVKLAAGYEGVSGHGYPVWETTDAAGRAAVVLDRPGAWFVRTLHMIPAEDDPEADWRSAFSTLTFEVLPAEGAAALAVRDLLEAQVVAWNRGDIDGFMEGYWRSEQLTFAGANGVTRGWQAVLERYRRNYPDRSAMGRLRFSNLEVTELSSDAVLVLGRWRLEREQDAPGGTFTLVARRLPATEGWRIVHDHTSADAPRN